MSATHPSGGIFGYYDLLKAISNPKHPEHLQLLDGSDVHLIPTTSTSRDQRHVPGFENLASIWDADFLYGPARPSGEDTYVFCEINISSVLPLPEQAPSEIARLALGPVAISIEGYPVAAETDRNRDGLLDMYTNLLL